MNSDELGQLLDEINEVQVYQGGTVDPVWILNVLELVVEHLLWQKRKLERKK